MACLNLLNSSQTDSKLVITTLRTLTLLLGEVVIDRKEQVHIYKEERFRRVTNISID
jgi:hypothetical protein